MTFLYPAVGVSIVVLLLRCPLDRRGNGRHLSRPVARLAHLDRYGVLNVQTAWIFVEAAVVLALGPVMPVLAMPVVLIAWLVDDWLTGGDEGPKRKHEWARVKLRMPKPVKLRPVERVPVPA